MSARSRRSGGPLLLLMALLLTVPQMPASATAPGSGNTYQLDNTSGGTVTGFVFGGFGPSDNEDDEAMASITDASSFVPASGMLESPYYYSTVADGYFGLTFRPPTGGIPLSFALGIGTGGADWHGNSELVYSQEANGREDTVGVLKGDVDTEIVDDFALTDQTIEDSPGTGEHYRGTGSLTVEGSIPFTGGTTLDVKHVYTLGAGDQYIEVATTISNSSGADVSNVNAWVGTSDDWIGTTDAPNKIKGVIQGSAATASFNAACSGATNAIIVNTDDEYVMLYSPATGADTTLFNSFNDWHTDVVALDPADSEFEVLDNDGSYALYLPFGTIAAGAEKTLNWYYEGGQLGFEPPTDCSDTGVAAYSTDLALVCLPDPVVAGADVTCEVTGGDPSIDILWEADLDGVFATTGVTLDELGNGTFRFTAPPGSSGRSIVVRLVSWSVSDSVAVSGQPARIPAGGGPVDQSPLALGLVLLLGAMVAMGRLRRAEV